MTLRSAFLFLLLGLLSSVSSMAAAPYDFVPLRDFAFQARRLIAREIGWSDKWKNPRIFFAEKYRLERDPEDPDREVLVDISELWYVVFPTFSRPSAATIAFVLEPSGAGIDEPGGAGMKYIPWEGENERSIMASSSTEVSFLTTASTTEKIQSELAKFNLSSSQVEIISVNSDESSKRRRGNVQEFKYVLRDLDPKKISQIMDTLGGKKLAGQFKTVPSENTYTQAFAPREIFNEGGARTINIATLREAEGSLAHPVVYKKLHRYLKKLMSLAPCPEAFEAPGLKDPCSNSLRGIFLETVVDQGPNARRNFVF